MQMLLLWSLFFTLLTADAQFNSSQCSSILSISSTDLNQVLTETPNLTNCFELDREDLLYQFDTFTVNSTVVVTGHNYGMQLQGQISVGLEGELKIYNATFEQGKGWLSVTGLLELVNCVVESWETVFVRGSSGTISVLNMGFRNNRQLFELKGNANVSFENCTFERNKEKTVILVNINFGHRVKIASCIFQGNTVNIIAIYSGSLLITNSEFRQNSDSGVYISSPNVTIAISKVL